MNGLEITDIRIAPVDFNNKSTLICYATVVLNKCIKVTGISLRRRHSRELYICWPKKVKSTRHQIVEDIVFPLNKESSKYFQSKIIEAYNAYAETVEEIHE